MCCDTPSSFGKDFPRLNFFPAFAGVMAAVRDLEEGNISFGVRHLSELWCRQWLCKTSPSC